MIRLLTPWVKKLHKLRISCNLAQTNTSNLSQTQSEEKKEEALSSPSNTEMIASEEITGVSFDHYIFCVNIHYSF